MALVDLFKDFERLSGSMKKFCSLSLTKIILSFLIRIEKNFSIIDVWGDDKSDEDAREKTEETQVGKDNDKVPGGYIQ